MAKSKLVLGGSEMTEVEKKGIEKTKAVLLVCGILVVILAISSLLLFMRVNSLENQVDSLTTENDYLWWEVNALMTENEDLEEEIELARFDFYYVFPADQQFGVYNLVDEIYGYEWIDPYQEGVFDCSEMSAYLEWELENKGWHTLIIAGDSPFGSGGHAWLLVETERGGYMPVETTTLEVVWWDDPYFDNYFIYDYDFETIQDALVYSETEFDWWN